MHKWLQIISLAVDSLIFGVRRLLLPFHRRQIRAVLVDIDGTLLENFSTFKEALLITLGNDQGSQFYTAITADIKNGVINQEEAMIRVGGALIAGGFSLSHLTAIRQKAEHHLRHSMIDPLKKLQNKGMKVIISTKSSDLLADYFKDKYGFDAGHGTKFSYDQEGKATSIDYLVGDMDGWYGGYRIRNKVCMAVEYFKQIGCPIFPKGLAIITDSYTDIVPMKLSGLAIYLESYDPSPVQKMMATFNLYDVKINERDITDYLDTL